MLTGSLCMDVIDAGTLIVENLCCWTVIKDDPEIRTLRIAMIVYECDRFPNCKIQKHILIQKKHTLTRV